MKTDQKIISYQQLSFIRNKAKRAKKTIVFTSGCYDILHLGHLIHLNYCKSRGDILIVNVGNDKTVHQLKGQGRPINNQQFRARLLAALALVDYVVISEEFGKMDHSRLLALLRPDFFILNCTDSAVKEKQALADLIGAKLILCKRLPPAHLKDGISSTAIHHKIKQNMPKSKINEEK